MLILSVMETLFRRWGFTSKETARHGAGLSNVLNLPQNRVLGEEI